jgi:hypothetical protein
LREYEIYGVGFGVSSAERCMTEILKVLSERPDSAIIAKYPIIPKKEPPRLPGTAPHFIKQFTPYFSTINR